MKQHLRSPSFGSSSEASSQRHSQTAWTRWIPSTWYLSPPALTKQSSHWEVRSYDLLMAALAGQRLSHQSISDLYTGRDFMESGWKSSESFWRPHERLKGFQWKPSGSEALAEASEYGLLIKYSANIRRSSFNSIWRVNKIFQKLVHHFLEEPIINGESRWVELQTSELGR